MFEIILLFASTVRMYVLLIPALLHPVPGSFLSPQLSTCISVATCSQLEGEVELKELWQYKDSLAHGSHKLPMLFNGNYVSGEDNVWCLWPDQGPA